MEPSTAALIAGFIALLELVKFLVSKATAGNSRQQADTVSKQIQDLWDWHNVHDEDGVRLWYVRRSLEGAIEKLHNSIDNQSQVLRDISTAQAATVKVLGKMEERINAAQNALTIRSNTKQR